MPTSRETAQAIGSIGGTVRAARCLDNVAHTLPARTAKFQKYLDQVPAEITNQAERTRRAEMLRRADMTRLSLKAAKARRLKAEARKLEAEINAAEAGEDCADGAA